jgi:histidyl-tRNA synthetase
MNTGSLPGFRDFYPEDLALRSHIFSVWRDVARRYGFVEYDGPPLEALELYTRKSGDEIVSQLYRFTDQGGREVALRPEMTPSFARMVAARAGGLPKPIRWFSIPQLFRYERPQKGRLREHFQLNLDIVGESGELADVEVVAAAVDILRAFGLDAEDFVARVSDRQLVSGVLDSLGVSPAAVPAAFAVLDKVGRESEEWILEHLSGAGIDSDTGRRLLELGSCDLADLKRRVADHEEGAMSAARLERFFAHVDALGLADYVEFDAGLVRGLAYYTGLVFEVWDRRGKSRAICGGGRYDDLLAFVGGPDLPALGFGMGDVVLAGLLRERDLVPSGEAPVDDYVVCVSPEQRDAALSIVRALRERGRRVTFDYATRSLGRQFKAADQSGAERALVVGPDEMEQGTVRVRDMATGEERSLTLAGLIAE